MRLRRKAAITLHRHPGRSENFSPPSPDGGVIADYFGEVGDPGELAARLSATPGVIDHGLFPAAMVSEVLVGRGNEVDRLAIA